MRELDIQQASRTILRNGRIFDGSGQPARIGDIAIEGGRLSAVGERLAIDSAAHDVDLGGLAVAPGFIDLHTHSDTSILSDPACLSAIEQGVTTQAVGLCGFSAGPVSEATLEGLIDEEPVFAFPDVSWSWRTIGGYRDVVAQARPATNVTTFVGHNTVRRLVLGGDARSPAPHELEQMADVVRLAFDEGARGFTTGLSYAPGMFAALDELVALAALAAERGLPYHTHMRYGELTVLESVLEALETARRSGVVLNVSHMYPRPDEPADAADRLVDLLEEARADGMEVTFDLTIFNRGGGAWVQSLPGWARDGGMAGTVAIIRDPARRARLVAELSAPDAEYWLTDPDDQVICKVNKPENAALAGRSIGQIARERGQAPLETALDLLLEDGQYWIAPTIKRQDHLDALMRSPLCVPIGDGFAMHPQKHRAYGIMPKSFGTFPYLLGYYVRERAVLTLAEAVRRITAEPARRLGLTDRGLLAEGMAADLVVFNPATIANRATEGGDPGARPAGIERVMVNGHWAVIEGRATGSRTGSVL